ncbi:sensor histidine kinase [Tessaracoccus antarcticus]|uniref:histidine kinase n=1 Tax=Tessaracoccus antarcticus TaxID=2479848 RepID=A0A3M0G937_9ACTN|nr:histidine kinase [Tessaracoccus antarcticus]RMB61580.1 sensor histidine kinase [Tessaracoccus antarcticus]
MVGTGLSKDRRRMGVDALVAVGAFAMLVAPMWWLRPADLLPTILWPGLMVASLAFRRVVPWLSVLLCTVAGTGMVLQLDGPSPAIVTVLVIVYSVARWCEGPLGWAVLAVGAIGSVAGPLSWLGNIPLQQRFAAGALLMTLCLALVAVAYLVGRRLQEMHRSDLLDRALAEERFTASTTRLEQASQLADDRARTDVARELHDVVAHSLSVIVVQAEGAKAMAAKYPERSAEALDVIAHTGRTSIGEMRRIVALLRGEEHAAFEPTPSLRQIPDMVAAAGDRITLEIPDDYPVVPDSLGLAVFRVVQESVTNFLKHAGPTAQAQVTLRFEPDCIAIRSVDDGVAGTTTIDPSGTGVRGMRERVTTMGGTFSAGPRMGGGWQVSAQLPMPAQLGRSWLRQKEQA